VQFHPTALPVSSHWQSKTTLMSKVDQWYTDPYPPVHRMTTWAVHALISPVRRSRVTETGQQLEVACSQALQAQIDAGSVTMHNRTEMLDLRGCSKCAKPARLRKIG
jgi:hypothetical protein